MMIIRGLLQIYIAYLLFRFGDMYGYEIKKRIEKFHGKRLPQGMIYTTLKRMKENNILNMYNKNGRKYYTLTEAGKAFLLFHLNVLKKVETEI